MADIVSLKFMKPRSGAVVRDCAPPVVANETQPAPGASYRISFSLFGRRFFVALLAGVERRSPERLAAEGVRKSWLHVLCTACVLVVFSSTLLMCTLATAYLLKSLVGIDVLDDHFALHPLFFGWPEP